MTSYPSNLSLPLSVAHLDLPPTGVDLAFSWLHLSCGEASSSGRTFYSSLLSSTHLCLHSSTTLVASISALLK